MSTEGRDADTTSREDFEKLKKNRTTALAQLTKKRNLLQAMMLDSEELHEVKSGLEDYKKLFIVYQVAHGDVLSALEEEEWAHHVKRFKENEEEILQFIKGTQEWIEGAENRLTESLGDISRSSLKSRSSRRSHSSKTSAVRQAKAQEQARLAELILEKIAYSEKKELRKKKQDLDDDEKMFQLDLDIAKARAREKVFIELEGEHVATSSAAGDAMNEYFDQNVKSDALNVNVADRVAYSNVGQSQILKGSCESQGLNDLVCSMQSKHEVLDLSKAPLSTSVPNIEFPTVRENVNTVLEMQGVDNARYSFAMHNVNATPHVSNVDISGQSTSGFHSQVSVNNGIVQPLVTTVSEVPTAKLSQGEMVTKAKAIQNATKVTSQYSQHHPPLSNLPTSSSDTNHSFPFNTSVTTALPVQNANVASIAHIGIGNAAYYAQAQLPYGGVSTGHSTVGGSTTSQLHPLSGTGLRSSTLQYNNLNNNCSDLRPNASTFVPRTLRTGAYNIPMTVNPPSLPTITCQGQYMTQSFAGMDPVSAYPSHQPIVPISSSFYNTQYSTLPTYNKPSEEEKLLAQLVSAMKLPQPEVPKFKGEPTEYRTFMMAFKTRIEARATSDADRLYFLEQHLEGQARDLIGGCLHMTPDEGYNRALAVLDREYGDPYKVAVSYVDKALGWPTVKSDNDLKSFSIFLNKCSNAMNDSSFVGVLNYLPNLQALVSKLPGYLQNKWRETASKARNEQRRAVDFQDLTNFIHNAAEAANDPVFGRSALNKYTPANGGAKANDRGKGRDRNFGSNKSRQTSSFAVIANSNEKFTKKCYYCRKPHDLDDCPEFKAKTLDERRSFLKEKKSCYSCYGLNHTSKGCLKKRTCAICNKRHPTLLHDNNFKPKDKAAPSKPLVEESSSLIETSTCAGSNSTDALVLQAILPVQVKQEGSERSETVYAFYDPGSSGSFLTQHLLEKLRAKGENTSLSLKTMHGTRNVKCTAVNGLVVSSVDGSNSIRLPRCYSTEAIPVDHSHVPRPDMLKELGYLQDVVEHMHPYDPDIHIGLLIGSNCPQALQPIKVVPTSGEGPFAVLYQHGWVVNGPLEVSKCANATIVTCNRIHVKENEFRECILDLFEQDFSDAYYPPGKLGHSIEDKNFLDIAEEGLKFHNGHYVLPLPFRSEDQDMPNNRLQAVSRATHLKKRLLSDESYFEEYKTFIAGLLEKGHARVMRAEELQENEKAWYLAHHGVYHPVKKKLRVVFDCSARYMGTSLNDRLLQGPDLTSSLVGVLLRFRQEPVAFTADIEAMFHQVGVSPCHQTYLRFLWWKDGDVTKDLTEHCMTVHIFGATSSPSIANFALRKAGDEAEETYGSEVKHTIRNNFYVDDCLKSVHSEQAAATLIERLRYACKEKGFRLTKFISNSTAVLETIPMEERAVDVQKHYFDNEKLPTERALGMYWNVSEDTLGISVSIKDKPATRRGILSVSSSVYDPLGFASPFVLRAKKILQDLCAMKELGWDDPIPEQFEVKWHKWLYELPLLNDLMVNRCVRTIYGTADNTELHVFSDASLDLGYGAVAYLRMESRNDEISCVFLMGKARLNPMKKVTLPRLELTAAVVAVRLGCLLKQELQIQIDRIRYHTDSTTVLHYILSKKRRFPLFVSNRIEFIHEHTRTDEWLYVNTRDNPADHASRGLKAIQLIEGTSWLNGPSFLKQAQESWPDQPVLCEDYQEERTELSIAATTVDQSHETVFKFLSCYSCWYKLKRATAIFRKFIDFLKHKTHGQSGDKPAENPVSALKVTDLDEAGKAVVRFQQRQSFTTEMGILEDGRKRLPKTSSIYSLDPYLDDDGLIRVGGRLSKANIVPGSKYPILLPKTSHVTTLIIRRTHETFAHAGRNHVLGSLRERYWIVHANSAVRRVLTRCIPCRRNRSSAVEQKMADLPPERCSPEPPFTFSGVDFFGPFYLKQGRKEVKHYGVIFTCLSSRAIHLEVAASLDSDTFILALRRFLGRRGPIRVLRCDNGTNFTGAERELREAVTEIKSEKIKEFLLKQEIDWIFNPPTGSHMGGAWERQIRTVRKVLSGLSREFCDRLDAESFHTLLVEVEAIVNSRPLTTVSSDPKDTVALTPNHILTMKTTIVTPPPGQFQRDDLYLRKRWRKVQYLSNLFWTRWRKEFLLQQQQRPKWVQEKRNMKIGDVVVLRDDTLTRNHWPLARVISVEPDRKGIIRSVVVKTASNEYRRPVHKLSLVIPVEEQ